MSKVNCLVCSKETTNPKFCSRSCAAISSNKTSQKRFKTKKCEVCNTLIYSASKFCTEHKAYVRDYTINEVIYTKHHKSSAFALIRARARSSVKNEPQICEVCGYSKHIEVAHIKSISDFPLTTLVSVVNERSNLRLLCPNCHWEFDNL